jgi:hypothetical protein
MRVFMWHVHGSYMTNLVQTGHTFLVPVIPDRGPDGLGRARTWHWPATVVEVTREQATEADVDLVVLQRPEEVSLAETWLGGRRPGIDVPALYLEHNVPQGAINGLQHPMASRSDVPVVHVTHFNRLFWDSGAAPTRVIEHGVIDPGHQATGELAAAVAVINEPVRRARVTGADLLPGLASGSGVTIDLFGMGSEALGGSDVPQDRLHREMGRRRLYLHPVRWTSLGLSLIEAMHLGLPVVALPTTAVSDAVPSEAGVVSADTEVLARAMARLVSEPEEAALMGKAAREAALARFGLDRFVAQWNALFEEVSA